MTVDLTLFSFSYVAILDNRNSYFDEKARKKSHGRGKRKWETVTKTGLFHAQKGRPPVQSGPRNKVV
jgi:hypothetical protein